MRHVSDIRQGTVIAGHRHAFTGEYFHFRAVYAAGVSSVDWLATVTFYGDVVAEFAGSEPLESSAASLMETVKAAVANAIDHRDFFEATGAGELNDPDMARLREASQRSSAA